MNRRKRLAAIVVVMFSICSLLGTSFIGDAYAAQTSNVGGNALKVSPVRQDISADPGTRKTISVFVQNLTNVNTILHPALNDFTAARDESGTPSVILDEKEYAPSHSLKRYMRPLKDFSIKGNETKQIDLTIDIPKDAAGGGYYGAIRFEPVGENPNETINLSASVGSLILLKVNGTVTESVNIESFEVVGKDGKPASFFTSNKNLKAVVRFKNSGNVHVSPFGKVEIKKGAGTLSATEINNSKPLASVLPDSVRRFEVPLDKMGSFGKYNVQGNFGYGEGGSLLTASKTVFVVPVIFFILAGVVVAIILFLIFVVPRLIRNYNNRIIQRARRRR